MKNLFPHYTIYSSLVVFCSPYLDSISLCLSNVFPSLAEERSARHLSSDHGGVDAGAG